ncbi:MAG TPA: flagellar hook capping FlgD N-terminal domain-containing protein [Legionella sp.]|nr:flagellar hook capping FlgD N-terminal domain-containing protein [Legionella sp.]
MTEPVDATGINQTDYMNLFMQELTYQDPLKPVDNREFMAQMAQFSSLQEAKSTNEHLTSLLGMTSANQCLNLLGKFVKLNDDETVGMVTKVEFNDRSPPKVSVSMNGKLSQVELTNISEVRN